MNSSRFALQSACACWYSPSWKRSGHISTTINAQLDDWLWCIWKNNQYIIIIPLLISNRIKWCWMLILMWMAKDLLTPLPWNRQCFLFPAIISKKEWRQIRIFGGTGVIITPVKCKLAKLYFHTSELVFKDNLWFIIDSLDIATQRSRSHSYAGNKLAYQVLSPNLCFHFGVIIRITTRTSRSQ